MLSGNAHTVSTIPGLSAGVNKSILRTALDDFGKQRTGVESIRAGVLANNKIRKLDDAGSLSARFFRYNHAIELKKFLIVKRILLRLRALCKLYSFYRMEHGPLFAVGRGLKAPVHRRVGIVIIRRGNRINDGFDRFAHCICDNDRKIGICRIACRRNAIHQLFRAARFNRRLICFGFFDHRHEPVVCS